MVKKQKHHLLIFLGAVGVLWLVFFYYHNYRTLSVSEKSLQHEFQTTEDLSSDSWDQDRQHHGHSEEKRRRMMNDGLNLAQNTFIIDSHVKENSHSDDVQNNSLLYVVRPSIPQIVQGVSRVYTTEADKDNVRQLQPSLSYANNAAINAIPEWLRWDPLLQQILRRNISRSAWKHQLLDETGTTAEHVQIPLKPAKEPLLSSGRRPSGSFEFDLRHSADQYKRVVLSVVDSGYTDFAVNFQRLSVDAVGLQNFLFVCIDRQAVVILQQRGIACSHFHKLTAIQNIVAETEGSRKMSGPSRASDFGTVSYFHKSNAKTAVVLDVLKRGYAVLIIDADVMLFKDPFPYFNCTSCDVHFQMDRDMYNSGFAYIRPTSASIRLYETAWDLYVQYHKAHDQTYINLATDRLNGDIRRGPAVRIHSLSRRLFPCGVYYFEHQHRMFDNKPPCVECVMAHNNYMGTIAAKVYRFKENLMWTIDENGYYSSSTARYITYENPYDLGPNTTRFELEALKSALAISVASGRTLILPSFHCCTGCAVNSRARCGSPRLRCSLLSVLRISAFDRVFGNRYREHSFLSNRLVPEHVKRSLSIQPVFINVSALPEVRRSVNTSAVRTLTAANYTHGATLAEVVRWISKHNRTAVISFHSLYGNSVDWKSDVQFGSKLKQWFSVGFDCSEYEQWDSSMLNLANLWPGKDVGKSSALH